MSQDEKFGDFLEAISRCFIDRDFDAWRSRAILPLSLITAQGPVVMTNDQQLEENFQLYLMACDAMRLDHIYRKPLSLEDCKDGSLIGTYETNMLSHGVRATAPYTSSALLIEENGLYKMTSILNARGHHAWTGKMPPVYH